MSNNSLMLSISGIRGIIGESLTPEIICKYVSSFSGLQKSKNKGKTIILGYDTRPAVEWIKNCTVGSLLSCGIEIIDIGVVPTPTVQLIVQNFQAAGGIVITASHNPQEWCGLKFIEYNGIFLDQFNCNELFSCQYTKYSIHSELGNIKIYKNAISDHISQLIELKYIDKDLIKKNSFRIVVDTINGAGSIAIPELLKQLGCNIIELNTNPTGIFDHLPEPIPENLMKLRELTKGNDLGIAIDPDSDRCVLIDENGEPLVEEYTLALCVYLLLKYFNIKQPVIRNISTTRAIDDICKLFNVNCFGTAIGEVNVAIKMCELDSIIGGEGNGGVMLKDLHIGRDALVATALVLQLFSLERLNNPKITISEIKKNLPQWRISKLKIPLNKNTNLIELIEKWKKNLLLNYNNTIKFIEDDGLRVDHEEWWVHVRKSNTEPIIRVIGEGKNQIEADLICKKVYEEFLNLIEK